MDENRIIELEIRLAYQEDLLNALNAIVSQQQQHISRLENTCKLLHTQIESLSLQRQDTEQTENTYEIPPHY